MKRILVAAVFLALVGGTVAEASTIIPYIDPAGQGTQAYGGNLALTFTLNAPITVTELGVFNANGTGIISGTIDVAIYNTTTDALVTPVVAFTGGPYSVGELDYDVFQPISSVVLGPGNYEVDAVGFNGSDLNGNLVTGSSSGPLLNNDGGVITFTGAAYDGNSTLDDPLACGGCNPTPAQWSQFDAGTFGFVNGGVVPAPEPSVFSLLACCFAGVVTLRLRRGLLKDSRR